MPAVTAPMTGRTVGATTSFAVAPRTNGADGKPVLPVFGRARKELKSKKRRKHHSEWINRGSLRIVEANEKTTEMPSTKISGRKPAVTNVTAKPFERAPLGLTGLSPRRDTPRSRDDAEIRIKAWHRKHNLPWPGVRQRPLGTGKAINVDEL